MQWYAFCKQVWEGIQNQADEQIQVLGPIVHVDVIARLNIGAESFRGVGNAAMMGKKYSRGTSSGSESISQRFS